MTRRSRAFAAFITLRSLGASCHSIQTSLISGCATSYGVIPDLIRQEAFGLKQTDEDIHRVFFFNTELGEFDSSDTRFRPGASNLSNAHPLFRANELFSADADSSPG